MKHKKATAALKKVKKNAHKQSNLQDVSELHNILSNFLLRSIVETYDILCTPFQQVSEEDCDLVSIVADIVEELRDGPLSVDPLDIEANELIKIITSPNFCALLEAYTEITTKRYHMPELPDIPYAVSGLDTYGTIASLKASRGSNIQSVKDLPNGLPSEIYEAKSVIYGQHSKGLLSDRRKTEATLTGGGKGTALPPVEGTMKMVGIQKSPGEDLGITVFQQQYMSAHYGLVKELVIKRILAASKVERLNLLHEGDVIREVNGVPVDEPEVLQNLLRNSSDTVIFKIIPGYQSIPVASQLKSNLFLQAHFSYNPEDDNLIPCKEAGLAFSIGSILQVLKQDDPYWWQAKYFDKEERAGLIPSIVLQERRRAHNQSAQSPEDITLKMFACGLARRKKKKVVIPFSAKDASEFESNDIVLYEEVAMVSGFQRPVICLIGASGVGRRSLIDMLIRADKARYGVALAHTSSVLESGEEDNGAFIIQSKERMEIDNLNNKYVEFGEFDGDYYGTKYDSIREVVKSGRTCLFDCSVHAISKLRTPEFMPYVIFLAAPSVSCMKAMYEYGMSMGFTSKWKRDEVFRKTLEESVYIERNYRHLMNETILCDNMEATFDHLLKQLNGLLLNPQWVPVKWLY